MVGIILLVVLLAFAVWLFLRHPAPDAEDEDHEHTGNAYWRAHHDDTEREAK